jgi:uncharacterized membrane protein (Fun14 family)
LICKIVSILLALAILRIYYLQEFAVTNIFWYTLAVIES